MQVLIKKEVIMIVMLRCEVFERALIAPEVHLWFWFANQQVILSLLHWHETNQWFLHKYPLHYLRKAKTCKVQEHHRSEVRILVGTTEEEESSHNGFHGATNEPISVPSHGIWPTFSWSDISKIFWPDHRTQAEPRSFAYPIQTIWLRCQAASKNIWTCWNSFG